MRRIILLAVTMIYLAGCSAPQPPAVVPTAASTQTGVELPRDTLPDDGWFSIRADRPGATRGDLLIVYQNGLAVYQDPSNGAIYQRQLDEQTQAMWTRMFVTQANITTLNDDYPAKVSQSGGDDSVAFTILYRQGDTVKKVTAHMSGAPVTLQVIFNQFWKLIKLVQLAQPTESPED
jgi:hypothetical protein